jgi:hypothetical protein
MQNKLKVILPSLGVLLIAGLLIKGQQVGTTFTNGSGAPSGSCVSGSTYTDSLTGNNWSCTGSAWKLVATSAMMTGTTGSIGGSLLAAAGTSASGTATVTGATTGMVCEAQASDGTNMAALGAIPVCTVTATDTATVNVVAVVALTPVSKQYNVRVFP